MAQDKTLWIVEDDPGLRVAYEESFEGQYRVTTFDSLRSFSRAVDSEPQLPDLVVADLRLGDGNFVDYLSSENARKRFSVPFIVVSSVDDIDVLRRCFQLGAKDYLTKPFTKNELLVKTERLLKMEKTAPQEAGTASYSQPDIVLDAVRLTVSRAKKGSVRLTATEVRIFSLLQKAEGESVSRSQLQTEVWEGNPISEKALDVHLFHLRKKLAKLGLEIQCRSREGYSLTRVRTLTAPQKPY